MVEFFGMNNLQLGHAIYFPISYHSPLQKWKKRCDNYKYNPTMCCMNTEKMSAAHRCVSTKNLSGEQ